VQPSACDTARDTARHLRAFGVLGRLSQFSAVPHAIPLVLARHTLHTTHHTPHTAGTNDGGAATDPSFHYTSTYTDLVLGAAAHYGPALQVFLACGPMSESYCKPVMDVIEAVTAKGVKAHFLDQVRRRTGPLYEYTN
jgi:hypothetical protein